MKPNELSQWLRRQGETARSGLGGRLIACADAMDEMARELVPLRASHQVLLAIHEKLGIPWGADIYKAVDDLRRQASAGTELQSTPTLVPCDSCAMKEREIRALLEATPELAYTGLRVSCEKCQPPREDHRHD